LNNIKQLVTALQNHHDTKKGLPLASTAAFNQGGKYNIAYGTEGVGTPDTAPFSIAPGQNGDGYSWICLLLPFMEENTIWDKLNDSKRGLGRLQDAAFSKKEFDTKSPGGYAVQNPGTKADAKNNPYLASTKIPTLVCPSYPGDEDVPFILGATFKVGTGNYMAIASTHYHSSGSLESGLPKDATSVGKDCASGAYCGNGGMPFPGIVSGRVQKTGLGFQSLSDGTSKVPLVTESREDQKTSWYSGFASYVVGAWPNTDVATAPTGYQPSGNTGPWYWGCTGTCDISLNKGDTKNKVEKFYQKTNPHGNGGSGTAERIWGPSSRHPSIVLHGFADAHSEAVNEQIDKNMYLQMITRSGREVSSTPQ
jgi:hypothetical protein